MPDPIEGLEDAPYQLDPRLVEAVIHVESRGNPDAVSPKGARGLMQIMPDTARGYGYDPGKLFDPDYNRMAGHAILSDYINKAHGDVRMGLMMYNAGEAGVRHPKARAQAEQYADQVLGTHHRMSNAGGVSLPPGNYPEIPYEPMMDLEDVPDDQPTLLHKLAYGAKDFVQPSFDLAMRGLALPGQIVEGAVEPALGTVLGEQNAPPLAQAVGQAAGPLAMGIPEGGTRVPPPMEALDPELRVQPPPRAQQPGPETVLTPAQRAIEGPVEEPPPPQRPEVIAPIRTPESMGMKPTVIRGQKGYITPRGDFVDEEMARAMAKVPPPAYAQGRWRATANIPDIEDVDFTEVPPHINDIAVKPAIRAGEQVIPGEVGQTHADIMEGTANLPARVEHGFIAKNGEFLTRERARRVLNRLGATLPAGKPEANSAAISLPQRSATSLLDAVGRRLYDPATEGGNLIDATDLEEAPAAPAQPAMATYQPPMGMWRGPTGPKKPLNQVVKAPAIKVGQNIYVGKPGELHADIALAHPEIIDSDEDLDSGFIDHQDQYMTRAEATRRANEFADSRAIKAMGLADKPAEPKGEAPVEPAGFSGAGQPTVWVKTTDAKLAPATFQYKMQVDPKTGVSRDLGKYDWQVAGHEKVWWDADNKQLYVAHGHHRHTAAAQSDQPGVYAILWDSGNQEPQAAAHNVTKEQARAWGAMENFKDGRGTAVDAANYLRNAPELTEAKMKAMGDLDLKQSMMQQALGLRDLTEPIWHDVAIGKLKPEVGAIIGRELKTPRDQVNAWKAYRQKEEEGRPYALQKFEDIVRLVKRAPQATVDPDEGQGGLGDWGKKLEQRSTFEEQADILGYARRTLNEQGLMGKAVKKKSMLEKGETKIDVEALTPLAEQAKHRLGVVQKYTNSHPGMLPNMDGVMNRYSVYLAEKPGQRKVILNEAFEALMKAADQDLPPGSSQAEPESGQESLF